MAETSQPSLKLLYEKSFTETTKPATYELVSYCHTHDLVAVASETHDVIVYRITGHPAFTIKRRNGDGEVTALGWKQDGRVLGIGWSDGTYGLYSGESGRLLSQGTVRGGGSEKEWKLDLSPDYGDDDDEEGGPVVTRFGWEWHDDVPGSGERIESSKLDGLLSTEDWCDGADTGSEAAFTDAKLAGGHGVDAILGLTNAVATLDVTTVLPRLSAIPSHGLRSGLEGNRFGTQATTDTVFALSEKQCSNVDALLVCSSDGNVQLLQDDTVRIGTCSVGAKPVMHASRGRSACHSVLTHDEHGGSHASFVDLPLDTLGGALHDVISNNTKRIQNLLAYITQTVRCIQHDFTTGLQFPARIMTSMNTELAEKGEGDVITNLYHLAMTGDFTPTMLEWLVDIVKETNHKRWDQAVNGMYNNIQNHLFFNLTPALHRLSIAATTLRGHARFHEGRSKFEVPPEYFANLLEGVDSLRLVAQKMQLIIMTEHRQFRAFSKWLRVMIEIGVAGPGSKGAIETEERETPNFDYPLLLAYVKATMTRSLLARHVVQPTDMQGSRASKEDFFAHPLVVQMGYEHTKEMLGRLNELKQGEELKGKDVVNMEALMNLPAIAVYLSANVRTAMDRITAWQSKMLTAPTSVSIDALPDAVILDMQMTVDTYASHTQSITKLLVLETRQRIMLHSITHPFASTKAHIITKTPTTLDIDIDYEIVDARFDSARSCLLLVHGGHHYYALFSLVYPYLQDKTTVGGGGSDLAQGDLTAICTFEPNFRPEKLVIGGRSGKRVLLVFGNERREWKVLDLEPKKEDSVTTDDFMDDEDDLTME